MTKGLYMKLSVTGMKNNRQITVPYLITGIFLVAMFYMIGSLRENPDLLKATGSSFIFVLMDMVIRVVGVFSAILLFYSDSFLMKREKRSFGLYNILGMGKRHIAKIMFWDACLSALFSVIIGLLFGVVFSKLLFMAAAKLINISANMDFYISWKYMLICAVFYGVIYFISFLLHLLQLKVNNPIEMLKGSNVGEKEPKTKWVIFLIGAVCLAMGYGISLTIKSPISAFTLFIGAVVLVIIGTYFLFTAGSIVLLKRLRRTKSFYYRSGRFTAVAGLIYRMKQNAVGLASICILGTAVLVTVSTTFSLYSGIREGVDRSMPRDIQVEIGNAGQNDITEKTILSYLDKKGFETEKLISFSYLMVLSSQTKSGFEVSKKNMTSYNLNSSELYMVSADDYQVLTGNEADIKGNHALVYSSKGNNRKTISLLGKTWKVDGTATAKGIPGIESYQSMDFYVIVVPTEKSLLQMQDSLEKIAGDNGSAPETMLAMHFNVTGNAAKKADAEAVLVKYMEKLAKDSKTTFSFNVAEKGDTFNRAKEIYGAFLFIGAFLAALFLLGTILIIYYKQLSEGFDDRERFIIMQKVGMSSGEVRKTIRTQILTVFFLPLGMAAIHVAAAYPMIIKMISLFNMTDTTVFGICTAVTILIFALVYTLVYFLTARVYYKIVALNI